MHLVVYNPTLTIQFSSIALQSFHKTQFHRQESSGKLCSYLSIVPDAEYNSLTHTSEQSDIRAEFYLQY